MEYCWGPLPRLGYEQATGPSLRTMPTSLADSASGVCYEERNPVVSAESRPRCAHDQNSRSSAIAHKTDPYGGRSAVRRGRFVDPVFPRAHTPDRYELKGSVLVILTRAAALARAMARNVASSQTASRPNCGSMETRGRTRSPPFPLQTRCKASR